MKNNKFEYVKDFLFLVGFIAFEYGLWLLWGLGVALIVGGIILMILCLPIKEPIETQGNPRWGTETPKPPPPSNKAKSKAPEPPHQIPMPPRM